jgi:hypothetical protein
MVTTPAFNKDTATKAECLASANKFLDTALRIEAEANAMPNENDRATKMKLCDRSLAMAVERENLAFDGRA